MLRVRVLENAFLRDMSFSAERRESDDVSRKLALYVLPPIQSIAVGYTGQWSCQEKGFLLHIYPVARRSTARRAAAARSYRIGRSNRYGFVGIAFRARR